MGAAIQHIPDRISNSEVLQILKSNEIDWKYVNYMKDLTNLKDELLSEWLNVNVKTFRSYKNEKAKLKENLQEQLILLISLFKQGEEVFGSIANFNAWLVVDNFYLDDSKPIEYLKTVAGIRYIESRVTAIEYGDNV